MKVIVSGAGIGGLTTALLLHQAGIEVSVWESVPEIRPLGVGINMLPHAVRILTKLGLADELAATAIATSELAYYSKHGKLIWSEPRGRAAGYNWPQFSIHRGKLQMILFEAAVARIGAENIHTGTHLHRFEERGNSVRAEFIDRRTEEISGEAEGEVLVGAEGIHSVLRKTFYPNEGVPAFSGRILWRATTEAEPFLSGSSMIMAGFANQKFVAYPICRETAARGRSLVNWIAELYVGGDKPPVARDWNRRVPIETFSAQFENWKFDWLDVPALIHGASEVFEFPLVDRDPVPHWSFGRVTLLGDAAHPMYPVGSNGASQAILDAAALTDALLAEPDPGIALKRYEAARVEPTSRIVLANRQQGPEACMQIVEDRAPNGFTNLYDVVSAQELEDISARYKIIAGMDKERLNALG